MYGDPHFPSLDISIQRCEPLFCFLTGGKKTGRMVETHYHVSMKQFDRKDKIFPGHANVCLGCSVRDVTQVVILTDSTAQQHGAAYVLHLEPVEVNKSYTLHIRKGRAFTCVLLADIAEYEGRVGVCYSDCTKSLMPFCPLLPFLSCTAFVVVRWGFFCLVCCGSESDTPNRNIQHNVDCGSSYQLLYGSYKCEYYV